MKHSSSIRNRIVRAFRTLAFPLLAILASFVIGGIIIYAMGYDAILAYKSMTLGSFSSLRTIADTLNKATPIVLTGLSYAIAKRCGLINLGAEGQVYIGALATVIVAAYLDIRPAFLQTVLALMAGFLAGAAYGGLVVLLKNKFGATEVITTIMFNYIARYFCAFLVSGPLKNTHSSYNSPQSWTVPDDVKLPVLLNGTRLHIGLLIAIVAIVFYFVFLWKTGKGYEMRVVGLNARAAEYAGMHVKRNGLLSMLLAGGFSGLAGAVELLGVQFILRDGFASTIGFDGVAVALLGETTPIGIAISSLLFGIIRNGSNKMQITAKVPSEVVYIIQGLIILFIVGREMFKYRGKNQLKIALPAKQKKEVS